jgi:glucosyl-dolichyl phosphate glucuronosyltransferase
VGDRTDRVTGAVSVSVAICTWNRCEPLRRTLEGFTALRVPAGIAWELLVVNNNCSDDTDAVVGTFAERLPVRLLHERQPGLAHARNLAIASARGRYLLWTDDDVIVHPEWMCSLVRAFEEYGADWVFGRSEPEWPGPVPSWYSDRLRHQFALLDYGPEPFVVTDYERHFYGLNSAGTLAAHQQLDGFRVEFGVRGNGGGVGEDVDMFERALAAGMRIVYAPDAVVRHVIPPARLEKAFLRHRHWVSNAVYYRALPEFFPKVPWLLGLPRFFFSKALGDLRGYLRGLLRRDPGTRFIYELQLVRFARLFLESARRGFPRRGMPGPGPASNARMPG